MFVDEKKFGDEKEKLFNLFDMVKNPIVYNDSDYLNSYLSDIVEIIQNLEETYE